MNPACASSQSLVTRNSAMRHVRDSTVLLDVDVEPVGVEVLCHHRARLDDTRLLWEIALAECLVQEDASARCLMATRWHSTHRFRGLIAKRLAGQLVHPLLRLVIAHVVGGHSWNDERHVACWSLLDSSMCCVVDVMPCARAV